MWGQLCSWRSELPAYHLIHQWVDFYIQCWLMWCLGKTIFFFNFQKETIIYSCDYTQSHINKSTWLFWHLHHYPFDNRHLVSNRHPSSCRKCFLNGSNSSSLSSTCTDYLEEMIEINQSLYSRRDEEDQGECRSK